MKKTNMFINQNVPIVNNKNTSRKYLTYKGLHMNSYGFSRLTSNQIPVIKKLWNGSKCPNDSFEYLYSEAKITNTNAYMLFW